MPCTLAYFRRREESTPNSCEHWSSFQRVPIEKLKHEPWLTILLKAMRWKGFFLPLRGGKQTTHIRKYYVFEFPSCFLLRLSPPLGIAALNMRKHMQRHTCHEEWCYHGQRHKKQTDWFICSAQILAHKFRVYPPPP